MRNHLIDSTLIILGVTLILTCYRINKIESNFKTLESHLNIVGQKIQDLQYQVDVLTELQKEMK